MHFDFRPKRRVIGHNLSIARPSATVAARDRFHSGAKLGIKIWLRIKKGLLERTMCRVEHVELVIPLREQL